MRRRAVLRAGWSALAIPSVRPTATGRDTATRRTNETRRANETRRESEGRPDTGFEPLARLDLPGAKELVTDGDVAYVATSDGFATVDTADPHEPTVLARRTGLFAEHPDGPLEMIFDGKVGGDHYAIGAPALPRDDVPYAAMVFDVSDPAAPRRVLAHETEFYHHNVHVDDETLYLCGNDGDRNPLVCVDLETGEELGRWSVLDADARWERVDPRLREIHDVWVADGVAYCSYMEAGTWLVDVRDPADPTALVGLRGLDPAALAGIDGGLALQRARLSLPGNDHFAMPRRRQETGQSPPTETTTARTPAAPVEPGLVALNEEAWAAEPDAPESELGGLELWDPVHERRLARIDAPPTEDATFGGVWTTSHNFDLLGDRLYTAWYRGGVRVHDVSDPTEPVELGHWRDSRTTDFWTAQAGGGASAKRDGEGYVVASSWRDPSLDEPEQGAAVYTFPDPDRGDPTETYGSGFGLAAGVASLGAAVLARWLRRAD